MWALRNYFSIVKRKKPPRRTHCYVLHSKWVLVFAAHLIEYGTNDKGRRRRRRWLQRWQHRSIKMTATNQSQARPNRERINHLKHYTQYQIYGNSNEFHFECSTTDITMHLHIYKHVATANENGSCRRHTCSYSKLRTKWSAHTHTSTFIGTHRNGTGIMASGELACHCKNQAAKAHLVRITNFPLDWSLQWHAIRNGIEKFEKKNVKEFSARIQCNAASRQHWSYSGNSFWKFHLTTNVDIWCAVVWGEWISIFTKNHFARKIFMPFHFAQWRAFFLFDTIVRKPRFGWFGWQKVLHI